MYRRLPPLNAIRAFEASARNASFTRAADELCVTQGAVSRHVSALEAWLGVKLFIRVQRGIQLTPKGAEYMRVLHGALDQIEYGTRQIRENLDENTLRLKLPPTFAIRWLVPRLASFHAMNRNVDVQITTSHQPVDFDREDVDACIHSGLAPPALVGCKRLFGEILVPICSPGLLKKKPSLREPADLAHHVLLCSMSRNADWPTWLRAAKVTNVDGNSGLKFENSALAYQAVVNELGVALAQRAFVEEDLQSGRLVAPLALRVRTQGAYYFAYNANRPKTPRVAAFEEWIQREAAAMEEAALD
jgi:LysR family glycine cleavage system transcriptional activator